MLILAATPIGNLSDASKRLEQTLTNATTVAAEDTRELKKLCRGLGIELNAKLISLKIKKSVRKATYLITNLIIKTMMILKLI